MGWLGDRPSKVRLLIVDWIPRDVTEAGGSPPGLRQDLGLISPSGFVSTSFPNAVFATVALFSTKQAR